MEFSELVRTRRSIRRYQETPVPKELLQGLLETACWAPSGDNRQPWYFLALTEPEEIQRLKGTMDQVSVEIEGHLEGIFQGKHPEVVREEQRFLRSVSSAPVCILVFLQEEYEARDVAVESAAAATQTLLLAAHDKGLGLLGQRRHHPGLRPGDPGRLRPGEGGVFVSRDPGVFGRPSPGTQAEERPL